MPDGGYFEYDNTYDMNFFPGGGGGINPMGGMGGGAGNVDANVLDNDNPYAGITEGLDPNSNDYASQIRARIARQQWQDYLQRFAPIEQELINSIGNKELLRKAIARGDENVERSFDSARGQFQRRLSRQGVGLSTDQAAASERSMGLSEAAAKVASRNRTRMNVRDREMQILGGTGGSVANMARSNMGGG